MHIRSLFDISLAEMNPVELDLSSANERLEGLDLSNRSVFEQFIQEEIDLQKGGCGIGGYLENRIVYRRSSHYESGESVRCIHLGVDIWVEAGTNIYAPLDGKIHSVAINSAYGDYGGTIILEHEIEGKVVYSLYGHLSHASLSRWKTGDTIRRGSSLAEIGSWDENGNWPPHLHIQFIRDLQGKTGDYPGVCSLEDLEFYEGNCIDPMIYIV